MSVIVWPLGAVVSSFSVTESVPSFPASSVAVTVWAPGPPAPADQAYVAGDEYGADVSVPPVEPLQPDVPVTFGKATPETAVSVSEAVALSVNEPDPVERKNCVFVPAS